MASSSLITSSPHAAIDIPENKSFFEAVYDGFASRADQVALVDGPSDRSYTFGQLDALTRKCAAGLTTAGLKQGEVLGMFSPNLPEFSIAFFGALACGATVTTCNPLYTADELAHQLKDAGAKYLITVPPFLEKAKSAAASNGIEQVYVFGEAEGALPFASLLANDGSAFPTGVKINVKEDVACMPYSSGTTGLPKGVCLTHYNLVANLYQASVIGYAPDQVWIGILPFFHIYGMIAVLAACLRTGIKLITVPKFDAVEFLTLVQKHKITHVPLVPPIVLFLAKHPVVDKFDISSIKELISGAAPLGADLQDQASARLGIPCIRQGYGMTELSPVAIVSPVGHNISGSIGVLIPNTDAKVVDLETGEPVGVDVDGELCIRGPQVMKCYHNRPDATASTVKDGWLYTGDIGHVNAEGFFFIVDRLKELIKYKGFQVAPAELESLLLSHDKIADCAVIGVPDEEAGELPRAFVVKAAGAEITAEEVQAFIADQVAPHKKLRGGVEFCEAIPKSGSGKILRRVLKAQIVAAAATAAAAK